MRFKTLAALLLGFGFGQALGQSPLGVNSAPVEAELLKPLNVRRLTNGSTVFARVTRDWQGSGCALRRGSTLEATVELAELHKGRGESRLALAFTRAQCDGLEIKPMELILAAVAQVPADWENVPNSNYASPITFMNSNAGNVGNGGSSIGFSLSHMELRGINHHFPMNAKVQPGDVIDIKGMNLELGTGPNGSSILTTRGRDVVLDEYVQLLLVPISQVSFRPDLLLHASTELGVLSVVSQGRAILSGLKATNDLEVCAPPGCAVDLPVTSLETAGKSAGSIAIRPLGYAPRPTMNLRDFTEDDALAWLGPRQLLFTFNIHRLIRREGVANSKAVRRVIRAVLFDAKNHTIIDAVDWEVTDTHRYLWPLAGDRVLVHVGNELRVYNAGLEIEKTIPLAGELAFVRIAPNGEVMAVAVLKERHTPELHAQLQDELAEEPEEDVDVTILDKDFNTVAQAPTVSGLEPPTLLNEGQVVLLAQADHHYRIALSTWGGRSSTLARFTSLCKPVLSSVAPDLLFLLTCSKVTNLAEYRVIRADGKLMMRGEASRREVSQDAEGAQSTGMFAIKAVHASRDLSRGMDFTGADLTFEELRVYRAEDGKRMLAVQVKNPTPNYGGYALSPDGSLLAVLSGSQIQIFGVPVR